VRKFLGLLLLSFWGLSLTASNLQVGELRVISNRQVEVSLSWENAWNLIGKQAPYNNDAVYVFLKGNRNREGWQTILVSKATSSTELVKVATKSIGVIVKTATQTETSIGTKIILEFEEPLLEGSWDLRAYAIEMIAIPEGSFWLGDSLSNLTLGSKTGSPLHIENEPISVFEKGDSSSILLSNPSGYSSFYLMKQEVSQGQYVDFLNSIPSENQLIWEPSVIYHPINSPGRNRNSILKVGSVYGCDANNNGILNEVADGNAIACNWITASQLLGYLNWSGLRPITELEFEKACRGPLKPKPKEFAWGSQYVVDANEVKAPFSANETALELGNDSSGLANHALLAGEKYILGPLRSGFAANSSTNRVKAGAGYYGNLDLSGNLWEVTLNYKSDTTLPLGNGSLDIPKSWGSTENYIVRGGAWFSLVFNNLLYGFRDLAVSDRFYKTYNLNETRGTIGGRGAL